MAEHILPQNEEDAAKYRDLGEPGGASYRLGDQYGSDFRFLLLMRLIDSGDLNIGDAEEILSNTDANDPASKIIGIVSGQNGVASKQIERVLQGSEWAVKASDVEEISKDFSDYKRQLGGVALTTGRVMRGYIMWPTKALGAGIRAAGEAAISPLWGEEGYYGTEREQDRDHRTETRNVARDEIERLYSLGYISKSKREELRNRTGKYESDDYEFLLDELRQVYTTLDDEDAPNAYVTKMLKERIDVEPYVEEDFRTLSRVAPGDEPRIGEPDFVDGTELDDPYGQDGSYYAQIAGDGVVGPAGVEGQPGPRPRATSPFMPEDTVYDRSTGRTFSTDEWDYIKRNAVAQGAYLASKSVSPAVQELLDKPFFSRVPGRVELPENIDQLPEDTQRQIREAAQVSRRWAPQMPIEDLAIPSLVPTEPWEVSTFDFRAGDGRSQWMSFTPRQRKMRTKLMADEGLITQEQMNEMEGAGGLNLVAMGVWESAIQLSSDTQYDPLATLQAIGQQKRVMEASAARTGRGGGGRRAPFSVPASLRDIPDYKTLATETKSLFSNQLGRNPEDWELALLADEMKDKYTRQNRQMIGIAKSAYDDAVAGGTLDIDFTEVEDPAKGMSFDIGEMYSGELDRQERVEDRANSRRVLMDSISIGQRMI